MYTNAADVMSRLPPDSADEMLPRIRREFLSAGKTLVVLDDDPTGTQTCYDVVVLTSWNVPLLVRELKKRPSILFILTNSRSLPSHAATALAAEVGENLLAAGLESAREFSVISRSDSTLRGHFPVEVDAVLEALKMQDAVRLLVPAFIEGGRLTIDDVHYILEKDTLIPVSETPFAQDTVFGYRNSNLRAWVEEKTNGAVRADNVISISISDIRIGGVEAVLSRLKACKPAQVCVANACSHKDLEVLVMALMKAEQGGQKFIYRTSATFVSIRAGLAAGKIFNPDNRQKTKTGSLVVVGSYVPKTTRQLVNLLRESIHHSIEVNVRELLISATNESIAEKIIRETDAALQSGKDVVIHTSRQLEKGHDTESSLKINSLVSSFLVRIVGGLSVRPDFVVAKGGITSSDLATKALNAEKAIVLGQIIPGVPVWKMDPDSKFPDLIYVVFPGNVGDENALMDVCKKLKG